MNLEPQSVKLQRSWQHDAQLTCCRFSPDGVSLIAAGHEGHLHRYCLDGDDYERVDVPPSRAERHEVHEVSGQRAVPVLVDGDVVLDDEDKILPYLEQMRTLPRSAGLHPAAGYNDMDEEDAFEAAERSARTRPAASP